MENVKGSENFPNALYIHCVYTLPFRSSVSLRNALVFHENIHEISSKMNRKYEDVDKVINNDF